MESSWSKEQTSVPCIGRQTLHHWITREAPIFFNFLYWSIISFPSVVSFFFFSRPHHKACRISVPWAGTEPEPLHRKCGSLNPWTAREFLTLLSQACICYLPFSLTLSPFLCLLKRYNIADTEHPVRAWAQVGCHSLEQVLQRSAQHAASPLRSEPCLRPPQPHPEPQRVDRTSCWKNNKHIRTTLTSQTSI